MKLSDFDLRQLDEESIHNLPEVAVKKLSVTLLNDLKEARERLNQNSKNSSAPPSREAPWDKSSKHEDEEHDACPLCDIEALEAIQHEPQKSPPDEPKDEATPLISDVSPEITAITAAPSGTSRKPGKQMGAPGFGRVQKITVHRHEHHHPEQCVLCHETFGSQHGSIAHTAFDSLTLEWGNPLQPGITVVNTRHVYYHSACSCGHVTQALPLRQPPDSSLPGVDLSEWRLVGPSLAAFIVCLSFRMRLSRPRIREFLHDWLGISLELRQHQQGHS